MSTQSTKVDTTNQLFTDTDITKIFVFDNRFEDDNFVNNSDYDPITLLAGTVMGRVSATGSLRAVQAGASDGSEFIVGILAEDLIVVDGETETATICVSGDVVESKLLFFNSAATGFGLDTVTNGRRQRDRIAGDTVGVKLVAGDQLTGVDNS